jgi:hypothetical protein
LIGLGQKKKAVDDIARAISLDPSFLYLKDVLKKALE